MSDSPWGRLDHLVQQAETLAGAWGARARASTSIGQERAVLRLCGVHGVDRAGRPLAGEVVERYLAGRSDRLAGGLLLPFATALLEYDQPPVELALDVASGAVDLAFEAELLRQPARREAATLEARRLIGSALARIDANRTARLEILDVLGESERPWFGASLQPQDLDAARLEALRLIEAGADLIRVAIPAGRELMLSMGARQAAADNSDATGAEGGVAATADAGATAGESASPGLWRSNDEVPVGSQRGLAELRAIVDEAGAERRRYVRLGTSGSALAAPEQAVVGAFERIDLVEIDAITEIVSAGVDPDRALADHAFAHRLLRRSGAMVLIGAGPLVVAPDLAAGVPSAPATRAGRAIALQLLSVALARSNGLTDGQIVAGAMPAWLAEERDSTAQAIAQVAIRRALFPANGLAFDEPPASVASEGWPFLFVAAAPGSEPTVLVMRRSEPERVRHVGDATRAAAEVARAVTMALGPRVLHGAALDHARAAIIAAETLLVRLAEEGWGSVLGPPLAAGAGFPVARQTAIERTEEFDPLAVDSAARAEA